MLAPAFAKATAHEGLVITASRTRHDPSPLRSTGPASPADSRPAFPAQFPDAVEERASPAAARPAPSLRVKNVDLTDADPALHTRTLRMLDQHKALWMGLALGVIEATQHRFVVKAGPRPIRFAPSRAADTEGEAETSAVRQPLEADVTELTSSEWGCPILLVPKKMAPSKFASIIDC